MSEIIVGIAGCVFLLGAAANFIHWRKYRGRFLYAPKTGVLGWGMVAAVVAIPLAAILLLAGLVSAVVYFAIVFAWGSFQLLYSIAMRRNAMRDAPDVQRLLQ